MRENDTIAKVRLPANATQTPAMQQFFRAKEQFPDALIFFRMGDFYELFFDDAVVASQALELTLTSRSKNKEGEAIPMAGVPHHAAEGYLARLLEKGFKVAICEQMADPKTVRGLVPREVVQVLSPGAVVSESTLAPSEDNWLVALVRHDELVVCAALELSRSVVRICVLRSEAEAFSELGKLHPREVVLRNGDDWNTKYLKNLKALRVQNEAVPLLVDLKSFGIEPVDLPAHAALSLVLSYAQRNQPQKPLRIATCESYEPSSFLEMDDATVRHLELFERNHGEKTGTLFSVLNRTQTAMGGRLLRRRLLHPLADAGEIRLRHDRVQELLERTSDRRELANQLMDVGDIERIVTRAEMKSLAARDLLRMRNSLQALPGIQNTLAKFQCGFGIDAFTQGTSIDSSLNELCVRFEDALVDQFNDESLLRDGADAEVDRLRALRSGGEQLLLSLEQKEKAATGIHSLRAKYTRVFGYYFEVSRPNLALVPPHFRRKQTIANGERFTTEELDHLQVELEQADTLLSSREAVVLEELRALLVSKSFELRKLAGLLSSLDVDLALAEVAALHGYVRPTIDESSALELEDCRHPVVEQSVGAGRFVPNSVELNHQGSPYMWTITGPNMAGKSTLMRQSALCILMAQMGAFVPAKRAHIGVVDRLFTRIGASDDLSAGESTFLVEMRETARILSRATSRSFVVMDEVGRGTSTFDGIAIAWATAEHLANRICCRTLFATHYHELCKLADTMPTVLNVNALAEEQDGEVVFLHRIAKGASNRSHGIAVAKLAQVPATVLSRAREILERLESERGPSHGAVGTQTQATKADANRLEAAFRFVADVSELDPLQITPMQALEWISKFHVRAQKIALVD